MATAEGGRSEEWIRRVLRRDKGEEKKGLSRERDKEVDLFLEVGLEVSR